MPPKDGLLALAENHVLIDNGAKYSYGTAGFRMKGELMDGIAFVVGLVAALRSRQNDNKTVGIMITASHNPASDNGLKVIDYDGGMLAESFEQLATSLANAGSHENMCDRYWQAEESFLKEPSKQNAGRVVVARDTRPSGNMLLHSIKESLQGVGAEVQDFGILTTPQLHYIVRCENTISTPEPYGDPSEVGYYRKLGGAFREALGSKQPKGALLVDCANGVGALKLKELMKECPDPSEGGLEVRIINDKVDEPEALNSKCGADHVKTQQAQPLLYHDKPSDVVIGAARFCSLDGDADRIVYWLEGPGKSQVIDGDRIAALAAIGLRDFIEQSGMAGKLKMGIVQTAYANGAATKFLKEALNLDITVTKTGVKYLHHAAQSYDIGIYFEANGHGTVLFSDRAIKTIKEHAVQGPAQEAALTTLKAMVDLINQTVGDALSDMLMVEAILTHKGWGFEDWLRMYADLPNRLKKVTVNDRTIFKTVDAERKLSHPPGIQERIDEAVRKYEKGRAFARASGTEDAVRVYAEASTDAEAESLAQDVADMVESWGKQ